MHATAGGLPSYDSSSAEHGGAKLSVVAGEKGGDVLISITPPLQPLAEKKAERAPADICCVIDISGSMDAAATMPDESGQQTETQLSILDVVRHAMRTIMATLGPQDRMAVVAFSDVATVHAGLTLMDDKGKKAMEKTIQNLSPHGATNLWDGLKAGMDLLHRRHRPEKDEMELLRTAVKEKAASSTVGRLFGSMVGSSKAEVPAKPVVVDANRVASIFLLTDGMPNCHPPKGELGAFKAYLDVHPAAFTVNTFGFGYNLDSHLLLQLATVGGGQYCFIPDSGMVGTVFVHAVANALATYAPTSTVSIEVPEGASVTVLGNVEHITASWGVKVELGDLMYGQTRDLVVRAADPSQVQLSVTARFTPWTDKDAIELSASTVPAVDSAARAAVKYHTRRLELVSVLLKASTSSPDKAHLEELRQIAQAIRGDADLANHKAAVALIQDIEGQVLLALQNDTYYQRWGQHYLRSLARAHQRQHCVNFKDEGQLVYGADSPLFCSARDALDKAFDNLPAPKPSRRTYGGGGWGSARVVSSMSAMNSRSGPCVAGNCTVTLAGGITGRVDQLRRGDRVVTAAGLRAVVAVVRTSMRDGAAELCALPGGLLVTPWHPVRIARTADWVFPADIAPARVLACDAVYSLLLERCDGNANAHAVSVNGVDVIGLGHGVTSGILEHAFFADHDRVVWSLAQLPGIEESGVAHCSGVRRGSNGRVNAFIPHQAATISQAVEIGMKVRV
ncbi:hypothetical protein AURDEDRAFT_182040 [Auricularia subglabra TFB-10046 SS5]|nr:hypothetical protein AURDEDRAFT_182040 [Auricularia subglabra TFB-10046 SS5]